jgi:MSHA pilin protein MshD
MCTERQRGFTLVELILAITIVGVALAAVATVFITTSRHSADPEVQQQAQFIAEAYLEEILRQKFFDPDEDKVCPSLEAGGRGSFDNVCDYRKISSQAPANAFGTAIGALGQYKVTVTVTRDDSLNLNGIGNNTGAGLFRVMRVDVGVAGPNNTSISLSGYRTNYNCETATDPGCKGLGVND